MRKRFSWFVRSFPRGSRSTAASISVGLTLVMMAGAALAQKEDNYLTIKGSDTMVHLVTAWAEAYMDTHPDSEISITGGGSGTGIAALINGTTDVCASSRDMKPEEKRKVTQAGAAPVETVVARDGVAIVVHPSNPLPELTLEQIRKLYTGAYTHWSQVGGPDRKVVVLSRESSSGTYVFFQEHVLNKEDYAARVRLMPATAAIVESVASDRDAIGYVGLGYAAEAGSRIKALSIKSDANSPAVVPSEDTVRSGKYSVARPLYLYTKGEPTGLAKAFIAFCLGDAGQKIVRENGYVPAK